jgi:hypothetical protein
MFYGNAVEDTEVNHEHDWNRRRSATLCLILSNEWKA